MPDINMQVFEEAKRNQLVTEVDIQTQVALDDYQVQLSDIANPTQSQDNVVIDRHGEFLPHWNESLDFNTWIKMNTEIAGKRILMLRGNSNVSDASNGDDTFIQWRGVDSGNYLDSLIIPSSNIVYEASVKYTSTPHNVNFGISTDAGDAATGDRVDTKSFTGTNLYYIRSFLNGTQSLQSSSPCASIDEYHHIKNIISVTQIVYYLDDVQRSSPITTNLPDSNMGLYSYKAAGTVTQEWSFVRKYTVTEPTWVADGEQNIVVALKSFGRAG